MYRCFLLMQCLMSLNLEILPVLKFAGHPSVRMNIFIQEVIHLLKGQKCQICTVYIQESQETWIRNLFINKQSKAFLYLLYWQPQPDTSTCGSSL